MGIRVVSFTEKGMTLSVNVAEAFPDTDIAIVTKCSAGNERNTEVNIPYIKERIGDWAKKQLDEKHDLIFIGACGIAVRAIAPWITDKLHDQAVLVMDENGNYVIPILSGHMGGANALAGKVAEEIGAVPVITTATDLNDRFAVDLFAKRNGLYVENKDGIAKVSSRILSGKEIRMAVDPGHFAKPLRIPEGILLSEADKNAVEETDILVTVKDHEKGRLLTLRPKEYILGIGCKKGKEEEKIRSMVQKHMAELGITMEQIFAVASIDKKKEEPALAAWCRKHRIPFLTYTAGQLLQVEGSFSASEFVKEQVGVDNVCERAALCACRDGGSLVYKKHAEDGMTIAIAKREWRVGFDE